MENVLAERIKGWYAHGLWTEKMVRKAVVKGVITEETYQDITGNAYEEK